MTYDTERIEALLDQLIQRENCVLCYDASLIEQLPDVLRENFRIRSAKDGLRLPPLRDLAATLGLINRDDWSLDDLPELLRSAGIDESRFRPRPSGERLEEQAKPFDHWSESKADENLDAVIGLQKDLGMGRYNAATQRYASELEVKNLRDYLRGVTSAPPTLMERVVRRSFWEIRIALWQLLGKVDGTQPTLSIGPRWLTEIEFFRKIVGLRQHVGLDLFSDNPDLVVPGDMHEMPFPNSRFQLVFLKNVVDKSYNVRKLVQELIRIVQPGGIIIVDQVCGYGACTPLTRTDIQSGRNLLRLFEARTRVKPLVCQDIDISNIGDAKASGERRVNARLAMQILQ